VSVVVIAVSIYVLSTFEAPLGAKVFIAIGFGAAVINSLELWSVRRRLEAAIELLKHAVHEGG
jgi:hypothetical protein